MPLGAQNALAPSIGSRSEDHDGTHHCRPCTWHCMHALRGHARTHARMRAHKAADCSTLPPTPLIVDDGGRASPHPHPAPPPPPPTTPRARHALGGACTLAPTPTLPPRPQPSGTHRYSASVQGGNVGLSRPAATSARMWPECSPRYTGQLDSSSHMMMPKAQVSTLASARPLPAQQSVGRGAGRGAAGGSGQGRAAVGCGQGEVCSRPAGLPAGRQADALAQRAA